MRFAVGIFLLPLLALWSAPPVPYYGKVSIDGINYHGSAQFSFSLEDANGTMHWRNGVDANESIPVFVVNGRYSVMLGGQGMNPLPPELFLQHEELYLSVSFDKGDGPRILGPDHLITATPRALVAEVAKVAEKLSGAITSDMLSPEVLSKLDANQSAAPIGPITLDMMPAEVLADLNKSAPAITSITRDMLPADVLADLNKSAPAVGPITLSMLAPEVTAKLESNASGGISGPITRDMLPADVLADLNRTVAPQMIQPSSITTAQLNEQILKYLKPEITLQPQAPGLIFSGQSMNLTSQAEGKFLTYQWQRNGQPIAGATGKSFSISEVNGTLHDGNYTVVVSNDFGSVTSTPTALQVDGTPSAHTVASIGMEMIFCPPGTFTMGSPITETGRGGLETQHPVTLTNGFYLGKYEVTQAQYQTVMNGNSAGLNADPSIFKGSNRPVEEASWEDAQVFLSRLNSIEQSAGRLPAGWKYVLPTEAQWEYACRAGTTTAYSWGNDINSSRANYNWDGGVNDGNDSKQTVNIGQFSANPWGFFDMHGNVREWVHDWRANYLTGAQTDPEGPASGSNRVTRGGSWGSAGPNLRSAKRVDNTPGTRFNSVGFRVGFQAVKPDGANPEIILAGTTAVTHSQGLPFLDPGVEAHDVRDGNITDQIVVTGTVDMNSTGTYLLTYSVQDAAGNPATATRTVTVTATRTVDLNATVAMDMIWCPPGTFTMGSPTTEAGRDADREDEHNVSLTKGFYLGKYEVTQAQYEAVMTGNTDSISATPSEWPNNPNRPVEKVSWEDAQVFLTRLNAQQADNLPAGWSYALPTESQWEYACRADTTTMYSWGNDSNATQANYSVSGLSQTRDVGYYAANPWGFFDLHGNVWEWTADWYQAAYPTGNPVVDPTGPASGSRRARRGGTWLHDGTYLRSAKRDHSIPSARYSDIGFRVSLQNSQ